jgi:hypothetical protein
MSDFNLHAEISMSQHGGYLLERVIEVKFYAPHNAPVLDLKAIVEIWLGSDWIWRSTAVQSLAEDVDTVMFEYVAGWLTRDGMFRDHYAAL